jgi:hypothetical protein
VGKEAQICRDFVRRRAERRQWCEDVNIDLTRIRLRRDWVRIREARHFCHQSIELLNLFSITMIRMKESIPCHLSAHLFVIAIKQCQEACLRSRGAFDTTEAQIVPSPLNVAEVPEQFLRNV